LAESAWLRQLLFRACFSETSPQGICLSIGRASLRLAVINM